MKLLAKRILFIGRLIEYKLLNEMVVMTLIQWFPGHMAKAKREIKENLQLVDLVIELVDARIPETSQNPLLQTVIQHKPKITVLMKKDLADEYTVTKWLQHFETEATTSIAVDANNRQDVSRLVDLVYKIGTDQQQKIIEKGVKSRPVRALIIGIPNVGKSTLINRLANKRIAKIGDRPGITREQQWIRVRGKFELLDTPGMLWPKFATEEIGLKLAAIGTIKYDLTPQQDVAAYVINYLLQNYRKQFLARFPIKEHEDMWIIFEEIGRMRGALESGGQVNFDKVAEIVLQDFRSGKIG